MLPTLRIRMCIISTVFFSDRRAKRATRFFGHLVFLFFHTHVYFNSTFLFFPRRSAMQCEPTSHVLRFHRINSPEHINILHWPYHTQQLDSVAQTSYIFIDASWLEDGIPRRETKTNKHVKIHVRYIYWVEAQLTGHNLITL